MPVGYETLGKGGHKVLVLHGWFGDHAMFNPMKDALSLDEFTYVCADYRGYGKSKSIRGDYTMAEISKDAIELVDSLGWDKFSLVGHSMGGMAAQRVLADAPARVRKLVAITPVPASGVPFEGEVLKLFEGAATSLDNRRAIVDFAVGGRLSKTWVDRMARHSQETSSTEAFAAYFKAWSKTNFVDAIKGNKTPIKVIIGQHDPSLTADVMNATYIAWYPSAELEVIPNAGHYPMDETPIALATSMEAFLRE